MSIKKWKVTRSFFWHTMKRKSVETFIVHDEFGKPVCSGRDIRSAVVSALRIAKELNVAVEVVGD